MQKKHFVLLDFFRIIASIAVFLYHTDIAKYPSAFKLENGYLGVDFFFVLSGCVIAFMVEKSVRDSTFNAKWFLLKRLSRLMPGIVVLNILLIPTLWVNVPVYLSGVFFSFFYLADVFPVVNFITGNKLVYPSNVTQCWSLAIEEQFYILFAFCIKYIRILRCYITPNWFVFVIFFIGITFLSDLTFGKWFYKSPIWRMGEILLGVLIVAYRLYDSVVVKKLSTNLIAILFVSFIICHFLFFNNITQNFHPLNFIVFALLSFLLILLSVSRELYFSDYSKSYVIFKISKLGKYSYGLYLYHTTLFQVVPDFINVSWWLEYLITTFIIFGVTYFSYHYFENPIRVYFYKKISLFEKSL